MFRTVTHRIPLLVFASLLCAPPARGTTDPLGPHNVGGHGCVLCHLPSSVQAEGLSPEPVGVFWTHESATPELAGGPGSINPARPLFHTSVCLTCHDGDIARIGLMGRRFNRGKGIEPATDLDLARTSDAHPVHVPYLPNDGCDVPTSNCNPDHWPSRVDASGALTWVGDQFSEYFDTVYGRPVRFYPSAENGGLAMVECSSCHNPHSMQAAQYKLQGKMQVKPSQAFLRGWYETQGKNRDTVSKFCRSCHYGEAGNSVNVKETLE
jgi:Doubled CXXCH motif (Paired_CXXCH_1)